MQHLWQFYLLLILVFLQGICIPIQTKRGKTLFLSVVCVELVFIAGFRAWNIGNDTLNYINTFILSSHYPELLISHMEKGYLWYNQLVAFLWENPQAILLSNASIITSAICIFIYKYSPKVLFSVLLFIVLFFGGTLNIMRQYLAASIVLVALPFVTHRQFIPFVISCCLASTFHVSALIAISLYFLYNLPLKVRYLCGCILISGLVFILLSPIVGQIIAITGRYGGYRGNILLGEETKIASIAKALIQLAIMLFCFFSYQFSQRAHVITKSALPIPFLLWCAVIAFCVQFVSIRGTVLERLVLYFSSFNLVSIPVCIGAYPKTIRILLISILFCCFVLYASIVFIYRPEWNYILPFKFHF